MAKIKKRGLDYFPINTDFLQSRLMRRIMKREGDVAPTALLQVYSAIYAGEGYYVTADSLFYDDLADCFYRLEPDAVERIVALAVEYGLFDAALFSRYGILTSADIQRQFLFSKKKRTPGSIDPRYCLLPAEGEAEGEGETEGEGEAKETGAKREKRIAGETRNNRGKGEEENASKDVTFSGKSVTSAPESVSGNVTSSPENVTPTFDEMVQNRPESVTFPTKNVTFEPKNTEKARFGTHSIEQNSKEQQSKAEHSAAEQSKEYPLLKVSPETGGGVPADVTGREVPAGRREEELSEKREEGSSETAQGRRADAGTAFSGLTASGTVHAATASSGMTVAGTVSAVTASSGPTVSGTVSAATASSGLTASGTVSAATASSCPTASGTVSAVTASSCPTASGTVSAATASSGPTASGTVSAVTASSGLTASGTVSAVTASSGLTASGTVSAATASSGPTASGTVHAATASSGPTASGTVHAATASSGQSVLPRSCRPAPREWPLADIDRLQAPADGQRRNLDGLRLNLRQFNVPPREQYAIILKSNFGVIGHPMWKGFNALRESHGKIRLPGHYLLSLCK